MAFGAQPLGEGSGFRVVGGEFDLHGFCSSMGSKISTPSRKSLIDG
jgi:hypothetical protein